MDVFSLGMTCAYLLFDSHWHLLDQKIKASGTESQGNNNKYNSIYQEEGKRLPMFNTLMATLEERGASGHAVDVIHPSLLKFFRFTLACNESDRVCDLATLDDLLELALQHE